MLHNKGLVTSIKWNGKVLREENDVVYLPFGAEYSIMLKNLTNKKALVRVTVDNKDIIDDLIIGANSETEVERFFDENMDSGYKLKFIEKNDEIKKYRGDYFLDGFVKVTYQFEDIGFFWSWIRRVPNDIVYGKDPIDDQYWFGMGDTITYGNGLLNDIHITSDSNTSNSINDEGITVEGEDSYQKFQFGTIGSLEDTVYCTQIKLKNGYPLTTKEKIKCRYCGRNWKSDHRFCGNCGARLLDK